MALIRRKGSPFWYYSFTFGGERYRESTNEKTKAAAATVEAEALSNLARGLPVAPSRSAKSPTLREFSVRFTEWFENSNVLTPATKRFYRYGLRLLLLSRMADMPLDRITAEVVECTPFRRNVYDHKERRTTDEFVPCTPVYANQALRTLKSMTGKAVDWEVLDKRPKVKILKVNGRDQLIDHDTEIKLQCELEASTVHGRHNRLRKQTWLFMVMLQDTGMRPDEVYPMRIDQIDWTGKRIWVPEGKTANSRRFVGMSDRMETMLKEWCKDRDGWVFPSKRSRSGHLESIAKGFQEARRRAGVSEKIVPYSARHTYGTYQMEATGNVFAVSRAMGHADIKSMEPYQHPDTKTLNSAINRRNQEREQHRVATEPTQDWHTNWHTPEDMQ